MQSYGIIAKPTAVKNPQANYMIERIHLTMAHILRTIVFTGENWFDEFDALLQAVAWTIRITINTATHYSPGQLIFNCNMIIQTAVTVN